MRDDAAVRTTLDLDDDVMAAARSLAKVRATTIGKVISDLTRSALQRGNEGKARTHHGIPLFPRSSSEVAVTLQLVNELRDEN